jgi:hypothetical protein
MGLVIDSLGGAEASASLPIEEEKGKICRNNSPPKDWR